MKPVRSVSKALLLLALTATAWAAPSREEQAIVAFYSRYVPTVQTQYLREVVRETEKRMIQLCIRQQLDTMLCMGHRESEFDPTADDRDMVGFKRRSLGIYQTRVEYFGWLREFWKARGQALGPDDAMETQVAFGVAEFWLKLRTAHGNVWGGVRRYNGGGPKAHEHARKVMVSRRAIFGRPYREGETTPTDCPATRRP